MLELILAGADVWVGTNRHSYGDGDGCGRGSGGGTGRGVGYGSGTGRGYGRGHGGGEGYFLQHLVETTPNTRTVLYWKDTQP